MSTIKFRGPRKTLTIFKFALVSFHFSFRGLYAYFGSSTGFFWHSVLLRCFGNWGFSWLLLQMRWALWRTSWKRFHPETIPKNWSFTKWYQIEHFCNTNFFRKYLGSPIAHTTPATHFPEPEPPCKHANHLVL